jgi:hypothetical protein
MSVEDFLKQKATNFQNFLKERSKSEHHPKLDGYKYEDLIPVLQTQLIPIYKLGKLGDIAEAISTEFELTDPQDKEKVLRYLTCFCEIYCS